MHTYVHCGSVYNRKDLEPTKCPSMIDWIKKMWHIYTMEYYAAIKKNEFMSSAGTWMNLETIILSKLKQEQKTKHRIFSHRWVLNNENTWTQGGEHGKLRSVAGGLGEGQQRVGSWGGLTWREMPDTGDGDEGSKPHCHVCTYATILHVLHMYPRI